MMRVGLAKVDEKRPAGASTLPSASGGLVSIHSARRPCPNQDAISIGQVVFGLDHNHNHDSYHALLVIVAPPNAMIVAFIYRAHIVSHSSTARLSASVSVGWMCWM
jgi:hypothetical protein